MAYQIDGATVRDAHEDAAVLDFDNDPFTDDEHEAAVEEVLGQASPEDILGFLMFLSALEAAARDERQAA